MKLSDFSSVLQLGVGLHTGTVLLQSVAEFASAPLSKRIERLTKIARLRRERFERQGRKVDEIEVIGTRVSDAQSALELKKVQLFTEYRIAAGANAGVALFLFGLLAWAAVDPDKSVSFVSAVLLLVLSPGPALLSLLLIWWRWHRNTDGIRVSVQKLESSLFNT